MGSQRFDDADEAADSRDDKHRVETTRVPAPPSGYARIDSLDDLDDFPKRKRGKKKSASEPTSAPTEPESAPTEPESAPTEPISVPTERLEPIEHPPLPVTALIEPPLPETVPTEAVRGAGPATPVAGVDLAEPDYVDDGVAPIGEPYEEHGEALRSRRITDLEDEVAHLRKLGRRGTLDFGLLLLRVVVGAYLAVEGCRRFFGWFEGPSLNGFETTLLNTQNRAIGFDEQSAGVVAVGWSVAMIVVGIILVFGFLTPIVAAVGLATASLDLALGVTVAGAVHLFPDQKGSVAFGAALVVLLVTIILCGPGRYSVDGSRGWARRPGIGSVSMVIVGIALAVGVWMLFNGTNPLDSPGNP
ncbi:MAG TPA: DoxX family membrane protein [Gordonia sp. (in: high G+C Gram-positive bacteria)]|mgnify:CR=1 FL=1|uniref:DoxX family protein n=1 Tax=unclassified Gordonia (in: high G+C Gram-positive bacteria) TaxID=2657482 RepID=UPI0025C30373|nr:MULTISPECIES: DoxX family membrane protein [unclassified Gordonia (in: high G+C Gram-positive bacteria)]HNP58973.1 DoxX family membrane protein [Gordonia sp. (in: high G+C Gram-positive bacteria)]HRC52673.1 DoxX family membrane protein [Gordonia sp. (in: high G+C Gram-positive bacteria)]